MKVALIDYGIGNVFSVRRAFEVCGGDVILTRDPEAILRADRLVLPGVGAFKDGMAELNKRNLAEPIREFVKTGRPFVGICLGMQMLLDESEEFGLTSGLGLIPGSVKRIPNESIKQLPLKVPHVAWDGLLIPKTRKDWSATPLKETKPGDAVYLVHSFAAVPKYDTDRLAEVDYGGHRVVAAVQHENILGFQFHPERSGSVGLGILRQFLGRF